MIFYLLFFLLLFFFTNKYNNKLLNAIIIFYIVASICGIYTQLHISTTAYTTPLSVIFHLSILFLFISPIISYAKHKHNFIPPSYSSFKTLSLFLISIQLFSIIYFIPYDIAIFLRGNFVEQRNEIVYDSVKLAGTGIFRTIAGVSSYFYCINILLWFYSISFLNESKTFNTLLLLTSTSRIFQAFSYVGRDGILFWIFSMVFSFLLFHPYMKKVILKKVIKVFFVIGSFATFLLAIISISRFENSNNGIFNSLIDYFGQPLSNFGQLFDKFHEYKGTKAVFPWFYGEKGITGNEAVSNAIDFYNKYGFASNIFFSFVGSFYKAWGPIITLIIGICYSFSCSCSLSRKKITMAELILLMFSVQIIWHNYFYWVFANRVGNLFILCIPLLMIYFKSSSYNQFKQ